MILRRVPSRALLLLLPAVAALAGLTGVGTACVGPAWAQTIAQASEPSVYRVRLGSEVLVSEQLDSLRGRRIGLVMNATSRLGGDSGTERFLLDSLLALGMDVRRLFALEHGIRGEFEAGGWVRTGVDERTGLPVVSLYGRSRQPTAETLEGLDLVLFDVQDVGARFYTYLSAMGLIIAAAEAEGIPVWVLDRPNPAGGEYVSGWMLDPAHASYVGLHPIPMIHGMTLGELARMMVGEGWIHASEPPLVRVVPMRGWRREMRWPQTGLGWIPPSPNLPSFEHSLVYLGTCLVEGTTLSEGRGTEDPFLLIGSPGMPSARGLDLPVLEGAELELVSFTPVRIPGKAESPKHMDNVVGGVRISVSDPDRYDPVEAGLDLLKALLRSSPSDSTLPFLLQLAGSRDILEFLEDDRRAADLQFGTEPFLEARRPYLLYP